MMKFYTFSRLASGIVIKCFNQMIMSLSLLFFYMLYVFHFDCFNVFLCALSLHHRHIHIRDTLSSGSGILMAVGFKVHSTAAAALIPGMEIPARCQGEEEY